MVFTLATAYWSRTELSNCSREEVIELITVLKVSLSKDKTASNKVPLSGIVKLSVFIKFSLLLSNMVVIIRGILICSSTILFPSSVKSFNKYKFSVSIKGYLFVKVSKSLELKFSVT